MYLHLVILTPPVTDQGAKANHSLIVNGYFGFCLGRQQEWLGSADKYILDTGVIDNNEDLFRHLP